MSVATLLKAVHEMTPYERERDLTPIVRDILRAYSLKNYSLIWRYLNHDYAIELDATAFAERCAALHSEYSDNDEKLTLEVDNASSWQINPPTACGTWAVIFKSRPEACLELVMTLGNRKEFIEILQVDLL